MGQRSKTSAGHQQRADGSIDVIVLAGTVGHETKWAGMPRPLLPLPGTTLIESLFRRLHVPIMASYTFCANGHTPLIERYVSVTDADDYRLNFFEDKIPRGPAGCLRACEPYLKSDTVFVAGASVWFEDDPLWMVSEHKRQGNALTVFCTRENGASGHMLIPTGLYCADRTVLQHIQTVGYQDIKEQLVPTLTRAGRRVGAVTLRKPAFEIADWSAYLRVIERYLTTDRLDQHLHRQLAPGIWSGKNVTISPTARLVGPVFLGDGCRIQDGAMIIGPTILGNDCRVDRGAWVTRTIAPDAAVFAPGSRVTDQFHPTQKWEERLNARTAAFRSHDDAAGIVQRPRRSFRNLVRGGLSAGAIGSAIAGLAAGMARKCGL